MSKRRIFYLIGLFLMGFVFLLFIGQKRATFKDEAADAPESPPMVSSSHNSDLGAVTDRHQSVKPAPIKPLLNEQQNQMAWILRQNIQDITLHGKVLDQLGKPVAGAQVVGRFQVSERVNEVETVSDGDGLFTISEVKGESLGIHIAKAGYAMQSTNRHFIYSPLWPEHQRHKDDPQNPVVFKVWKLQGNGSPLFEIDSTYKLNSDGESKRIDLLTGQVVESGGDLIVNLYRPAGVLSHESPADWKMVFTPVDGGLIEIDLEEFYVVYEAPIDGYQPQLSAEEVSKSRLWSSRVQKCCIFKSRGGQNYGKLEIAATVNELPEDPFFIIVAGVANTNGSRNLEKSD